MNFVGVLKIKKVLSVILCLVLLTGCNSKGTSRQVGQIIDWVDAITIKGIHYVRSEQSGKLDKSILGKEYDIITQKISDKNLGNNYQMQDGDSTLLNDGTRIYTVKGYKPEFRLAAYVENKVILYEVHENKKTKSIENLLDIEDKVSSISIRSKIDGKTELGFINDKEKVKQLVSMIMESTFIKDESGSNSCFINFQLMDGTEVQRMYLYDAGILWPGILVKKEFNEEIKKIANLK